jgi:hypothetical protein
MRGIVLLRCMVVSFGHGAGFFWVLPTLIHIFPTKFNVPRET